MNQTDEMTYSLRIGLLALSAFLLITIGCYSFSNALTVFKDNSQRKLPIYCVARDDPKVSITFDAAWGNEDTKDILTILDQYHVKATFFMTGGWVEKYPADAKAISDAGHDLGNHSLNHKQMSQLSFEECKTEIQAVNDKVFQLTNKTPTLFRPPYGDYNNTLIDASKELNCYCIQWDVDSLDWKNYGIDSIIDTVLNHKALKNGSIILMHNGAKYTKAALPSVIEGLQKKGYQIVPVSQLIYTDAYEIDAQGRQHPLNSNSVASQSALSQTP